MFLSDGRELPTLHFHDGGSTGLLHALQRYVFLNRYIHVLIVGLLIIGEQLFGAWPKSLNFIQQLSMDQISDTVCMQKQELSPASLS